MGNREAVPENSVAEGFADCLERGSSTDDKEATQWRGEQFIPKANKVVNKVILQTHAHMHALHG